MRSHRSSTAKLPLYIFPQAIMCYLLVDFSTVFMCLFLTDVISHIDSIMQREMTLMTASPIGLYFEKLTRPICVTPSPGRSDAIHFAPWGMINNDI